MKTLRKIYSILLPVERKEAVALLMLMVIGMVLEMIGIGLVVPVISFLTKQNVDTSHMFMSPVFQVFGKPSQTQLIAGGMFGLVVIYLIKTSFLAFLAWRQARFAFGVQMQLSQRLFTAYLRQPYSFHLQRNSAQLIRNTIKEVDTFNGALVQAVILLTEILVLAGIGGLLLAFEPLGTLIVVLVLGTAAWAFYHITRNKSVRWGEARQYHEGLRIQHLQQGLGAAKDIILLGCENEFLKQYSVHNIQSARMGQFQMALQQIPRLWFELLAIVGMATLVLSMLALGRDMGSIMPTLGLFFIAAFRLMPSMSRVLSAVQILRYTLPVINTLCDELDLVEAECLVQRTGTISFQHEVCLRNICYTYPGASRSSLNGVSITIQKGEVVGIVGSTGSGKSTLIDVIIGLLTPNAGEVLVDGQDIQQNPRAWQDLIGYVPQTIYLTDDTIRRNVAIGVPDELIDDVAVHRALRDARLEEFVTKQPFGVETVVGERGIRLSGGQRQRIGIARALYKQADVIVFDEATSALDSETEREVMQSIEGLSKEITILIIAHRLTTLKTCTLIVELSDGGIKRVGSYQDIITDKQNWISRVQ